MVLTKTNCTNCHCFVVETEHFWIKAFEGILGNYWCIAVHLRQIIVCQSLPYFYLLHIVAWSILGNHNLRTQITLPWYYHSVIYLYSHIYSYIYIVYIIIVYHSIYHPIVIFDITSYHHHIALSLFWTATRLWTKSWCKHCQITAEKQWWWYEPQKWIFNKNLTFQLWAQQQIFFQKYVFKIYHINFVHWKM